MVNGVSNAKYHTHSKITWSPMSAGMRALERRMHSVTPRIEKFGTPIIKKSVGCSKNICRCVVKKIGWCAVKI